MFVNTPMFIDWITVHQLHIAAHEPLDDGRVVSTDADGVIVWDIARNYQFEGSHDSRILVKSDGRLVTLSGNVGRFNRSDNIFGFNLDEIMSKANRILAALSLPPFTVGEHWLAQNPPYSRFTGAYFTRLDLTANYSVGDRLHVSPYMQFLASFSKSRVKTGVIADGSTVDFGRGSKYWYAKVYDKYKQLTSRNQFKHKIRPEILSLVEKTGMVRFEITLKSRFLIQNYLRYWGTVTMEKLHQIFIEKSAVMRQEKPFFETYDHLFEQLPNDLLGTALSWKMGKNLLANMSKTTYYRHRKRLLNDYGIDISQSCKILEMPIRVKVQEITVIPMIPPEWYWVRTGTGI